MRLNVLLAVLAAMTISVNPSLAQSPQQVPARQQTVQTARYGTALGLPRDGAKLYLPDEAYPRFPLPPGNAAYAHVDGLKMKEVVEQIAAISRRSRDDGNQYWGRIAGAPYRIIDHVIYHTTIDTAQLVPAWSMEAAAPSSRSSTGATR